MEEYSGADVYVCLESQVPQCVEEAKALSTGAKHVKRRRERSLKAEKKYWCGETVTRVVLCSKESY
jgi:hypothetical protein